MTTEPTTIPISAARVYSDGDYLRFLVESDERWYEVARYEIHGAEIYELVNVVHAINDVKSGGDLLAHPVARVIN